MNTAKDMSPMAVSIRNKNSYLDSDLPIEDRTEDLLSRMTLEEKIEQLSGTSDCDKMASNSNSRLGIPSLQCADGPHGVRWGKATAFPVSIAIASSWEPELMERVGIAIAKEMKAKGCENCGDCKNPECASNQEPGKPCDCDKPEAAMKCGAGKCGKGN